MDVRGLPSRMGPDDYIEFAWSWLISECPYPARPKQGESFKGFRVYTDEWGMVNGIWQAFVAIEPVWAIECQETQGQ